MPPKYKEEFLKWAMKRQIITQNRSICDSLFSDEFILNIIIIIYFHITKYNLIYIILNINKFVVNSEHRIIYTEIQTKCRPLQFSDLAEISFGTLQIQKWQNWQKEKCTHKGKRKAEDHSDISTSYEVWSKKYAEF